MTERNQTFETFDTWVNKASSWLTRREGKAICYDTKGRGRASPGRGRTQRTRNSELDGDFRPEGAAGLYRGGSAEAAGKRIGRGPLEGRKRNDRRRTSNSAVG